MFRRFCVWRSSTAQDVIAWAEKRHPLETDDIARLVALVPEMTAMTHRDRMRYFRVMAKKTPHQSPSVNAALLHILGIYDTTSNGGSTAVITSSDALAIVTTSALREIVISDSLRNRCQDSCDGAFKTSLDRLAHSVKSPTVSLEDTQAEFESFCADMELSLQKNVQFYPKTIMWFFGAVGQSASHGRAVRLMAAVYERQESVFFYPRAIPQIIASLHKHELTRHKIFTDLTKQITGLLGVTYTDASLCSVNVSAGFVTAGKLLPVSTQQAIEMHELSLDCAARHLPLLAKVPLIEKAISNMCLVILRLRRTGQCSGRASVILALPCVHAHIRDYYNCNTLAVVLQMLKDSGRRQNHTELPLLAAVMDRYDAGVKSQTFEITWRLSVMSVLVRAAPSDPKHAQRISDMLRDVDAEKSVLSGHTISNVLHFMSKVGSAVTPAMVHSLLLRVALVPEGDFTSGYLSNSLFAYARGGFARVPRGSLKPLLDRVLRDFEPLRDFGVSPQNDVPVKHIGRALRSLVMLEPPPGSEGNGDNNDALIDALRARLRHDLGQGTAAAKQGNARDMDFTDFAGIFHSYAMLVSGAYGQVRRRGFLKDDVPVLKHTLDRLWLDRAEVKQYHNMRVLVLGGLRALGPHWAQELYAYLAK